MPESAIVLCQQLPETSGAEVKIVSTCGEGGTRTGEDRTQFMEEVAGGRDVTRASLSGVAVLSAPTAACITQELGGGCENKISEPLGDVISFVGPLKSQCTCGRGMPPAACQLKNGIIVLVPMHAECLVAGADCPAPLPMGSQEHSVLQRSS